MKRNDGNTRQICLLTKPKRFNEQTSFFVTPWIWLLLSQACSYACIRDTYSSGLSSQERYLVSKEVSTNSLVDGFVFSQLEILWSIYFLRFIFSLCAISRAKCHNRCYFLVQTNEGFICLVYPSLCMYPVEIRRILGMLFTFRSFRERMMTTITWFFSDHRLCGLRLFL